MKPQQKELFYKKLGENIAKARSETKVTQAELAEKTGLSRTTITNIERGRQKPSFLAVQLIAEKLGKNLDKLKPTPDKFIDIQEASEQLIENSIKGQDYNDPNL
ncbi:MAG: helix-turn-helix transcriptional regulator [Patescibacteria group bacterium]|jgi:transcriptional regulator with XRE-family HTH domain